jgi:hypothetical protein
VTFVNAFVPIAIFQTPETIDFIAPTPTAVLFSAELSGDPVESCPITNELIKSAPPDFASVRPSSEVALLTVPHESPPLPFVIKAFPSAPDEPGSVRTKLPPDEAATSVVELLPPVRS